MCEQYRGCDVAPYIKCNNATASAEYATNNATVYATNDLQVLAKCFLERSNATLIATSGATNGLQQTNNAATKSDKRFLSSITQISCAVALPKRRNTATVFLFRNCKLETVHDSGGSIYQNIVNCGTYKHFIIDKIGNGTGIGDCDLGISATWVLNGGKMPLYPNVNRYCSKFSEHII